MQDAAAFTGLRTPSIQQLRDFGYRLCEGYANGGINERQYELLMRRYQKNTVALLAIEQLTGAVRSAPVVLTSQGMASLSKSLVEQREQREKINDEITTLEGKKANAKKADAKADTSELDGKIKRLVEDRDVIDKAISNTQGIIVNGRIDSTIKTEASPAQRSDEHIGRVAELVAKSSTI